MRFDELILDKVIFELKYDEGLLYWDKMGEILQTIKKEFPEWDFEQVSPDGTKLVNNQRNMALIYDYNRTRIVQDEVENLNQFKKVVSEIAPLILNKIQVKMINRIGNRFHYLYPLESPIHGKDFISKCPLVNIPGEKLSLFGKNPQKRFFVVLLEEENMSYRIELAGIERKDVSKDITFDERKKPKYALRIDVDIASIVSMDISETNCSEIIQSNKKFFENNLIKILQ
jgi:hypothetical protein